MMQQIILKWGPRIVWPINWLLILLLVIFTLVRIIDLMNGAPGSNTGGMGPPPEFTDRYFDHVTLSVVHMLTGLLFVLIAPFQFWKKFRAKNRILHRWTGRILLIAGLVSAVTGVMAAHALPGFAGFSTLLASWFLGPAMALCLISSGMYAWNKDFVKHREWIIRAFAIGLSVGTQRLLIFIFMPMQLASFYDIFGPTLWLGAALNLIVAETWINLTRK